MDEDIYTEPEEIDLETLRHLGPLAALAGTWEGEGVDTHPVAHGSEDEPYRERIVFEAIDPQPNGPQLLYGLRYHQHVNKLDEPLTFHDQVGYWLWEAAAGARSFTVRSTLRSPTAGIVSAPFLDRNFSTTSYQVTFTVHDDGTIAYEQDTVLQIARRPEPFH